MHRLCSKSWQSRSLNPIFSNLYLFFWQYFDLKQGESWTYGSLTFEVLRNNQLIAKLSKWQFNCAKISYLGHLISTEGVQADSKNIEAVLKWPQLSSIKSLRGFLGLMGYYWRFIKGYWTVTTKLTGLLRKNCFEWDQRRLNWYVNKGSNPTTHPSTT